MYLEEAKYPMPGESWQTITMGERQVVWERMIIRFLYVRVHNLLSRLLRSRISILLGDLVTRITK